MASQKSSRLFIIGGKAKQCVEHFVSFAGGSNARILVIPHASSIALEVAADFKAELEALGVRAQAITVALPDQPLVIPRGTTGIYMCGGDQEVLVRLLGPAGVNKLRRYHRRGGLIAGTSAGAAAVGVDIITGGMADGQLRAGALLVGKGIGLIKRTVVDTHFRERARFNRLVAAVLLYPGALGIGLDEDTAVLIEDCRTAGATMTVFGVGHVWFYNGAPVAGSASRRNSGQKSSASAGQLYSARDINVSVLSSGDSYLINFKDK